MWCCSFCSLSRFFIYFFLFCTHRLHSIFSPLPYRLPLTIINFNCDQNVCLHFFFRAIPFFHLPYSTVFYAVVCKFIMLIHKFNCAYASFFSLSSVKFFAALTLCTHCNSLINFILVFILISISLWLESKIVLVTAHCKLNVVDSMNFFLSLKNLSLA